MKELLVQLIHWVFLAQVELSDHIRMTKSGFRGIKLSLQFNFLLFNASQKEMGEKQDQGRLHVADGGGKSVHLGE